MAARLALIGRLLAIAALFGLLLGVYLVAIRPGKLRWGATAQELSRPLPGDDLVAAPSFEATRAVTIMGRPEEIWPWIVQIGYGRAGFYGYDLIENLGSPRGIRSARRIVPELQRLAPGDRVYMSAIAYLVVDSMAADRFLIWKGLDHPTDSAFTFALSPVDARHTRLLLRIRLRYHWTDWRLPLDLFTEFADHVAVPKMLLGIRDRVEGHRVESLVPQGVQIAIWMVVFLEWAAACILILISRRWRRVWGVALLAGFALQFVIYAGAPVWIGTLPALAILAGLVWLWNTDRRLPSPHEH